MPTWRERLKAHGEVPRGTLDDYKVAGGGVYQYVLDLDSLRAEGASLPAVQAALLAGWVAFSLQVLGDEMLDSDAALDPATAHFVPPATAQQVTEFYEPVRAWMGRAQAAKANASYRLDVPLPEVLPPWVQVEPCPPAHLFALRQAVTRLRDYTEGLVPGFDTRGHASDLVAQGLAEAGSAADYASGMWGATTGAPLAQSHEVIESSLKNAAETYFYLGQVIAMPSLAEAPRRVHDEALSKEQPRSFLESMTGAYPQVGQRRQGGALAGAAGGFLGGLIGGSIIQEILGGSGLGGSGFGGGDEGGGFGGGDEGGGFGGGDDGGGFGGWD